NVGEVRRNGIAPVGLCRGKLQPTVLRLDGSVLPGRAQLELQRFRWHLHRDHLPIGRRNRVRYYACEKRASRFSSRRSPRAKVTASTRLAWDSSPVRVMSALSTTGDSQTTASGSAPRWRGLGSARGAGRPPVSWRDPSIRRGCAERGRG